MPKKKKKSTLEQRIENFAEEVEILGKNIDKEGEEIDNWFRRTLGILGPLISSVFSILVLSFIILALNFFSFQIRNIVLFDIYSFLMTNIGLFFLISLFFSYASYFSKSYPKFYLFFSPIVTAVGVLVGFWIFLNFINIVNYYLENLTISVITFFINRNLFSIFLILIFLGYLTIFIKSSIKKSIKTRRIIVKKNTKKSKSGKMYRLYRSGKEKILGGVCGGIGEYLDVDPVIIRLLWIIGSFAWGFGILAYIIAWIIIPRNPNHKWN